MIILNRKFHRFVRFVMYCIITTCSVECYLLAWKGAACSPTPCIWVFKNFPGVIPRTLTGGVGDPLPHLTSSSAFGQARDASVPVLGPKPWSPELFIRGCAPDDLWCEVELIGSLWSCVSMLCKITSSCLPQCVCTKEDCRWFKRLQLGASLAGYVSFRTAEIQWHTRRQWCAECFACGVRSAVFRPAEVVV